MHGQRGLGTRQSSIDKNDWKISDEVKQLLEEMLEESDFEKKNRLTRRTCRFM